MIPETKESKVRFTWNLLYDCNYRCPYCFFEGKWEEYKKRNVYLSPHEWMLHWNRIFDRYGPPCIIITGGEPFLYPQFIEIIKMLSGISGHINISSNSSGDLETFVNEINPDKVSLSISYQPEFDKIDNFLDKVIFLRKYKFNGCLNFVAYPPYIKDIQFYRDRFKSVKQRLKVIPFFGEYQEITYPQGYTEEQRDLIGIDDNWFRKVRRKGALCPAGKSTALIFPDGKVARCGQIGEDMILGSFFDPSFKLLDESLPCDAEFCPCDEDKVYPEEDVQEDKIEFSESFSRRGKLIITENLLTQQNILSNSQLNEEEFNSHRLTLESSPKAIFIQAAGPCNSNCVFCSRGSDYETFDLDTHRRRFEERLYPFISKAEELILTGSGEYLLTPQSETILDFFDKKFPYTKKIFSTNGSSLVPKICDRIAYSKSKYIIHISLHASNSELHRVLTRTDNFYKILGHLKYLINLKRKTDNPEIRLIFVATNLNIEDLPNFIKLAYNLGVDRVICYYNYIYVPAQKYLSCFFKRELTNRVLSESEELSEKLNIKVDLPPKFGLEKYPARGICREAWSQIMFTSQGNVLPCDASEDCYENLIQKNFMDIWNSGYYQSLRKSLIEKSASCFTYCFRANPQAVNDFRSHVIRRGRKESEIDILWADNF